MSDFREQYLDVEKATEPGKYHFRGAPVEIREGFSFTLHLSSQTKLVGSQIGSLPEVIEAIKTAYGIHMRDKYATQIP